MVDISEASTIDGGVVVVVDVMRAFTVAAWALARGAQELRLVEDVEHAVRLAAAVPDALLFKDGAPDDRFDLHNSPRQLLDLDVAGRPIVQRTTAGTRAVLAARRAHVLYCASFVCASATARVLRRLSVDVVTFVISGGSDAEEDLACSEFIAEAVEHDDVAAAPFARRAERSAAADDLRAGVRRGFSGVTDDDVPMCLDIDRFDFAMRAVDERAYVRLVLEDVE